MTEIDKLHGALQRVGRGECPSCNGKEWEVDSDHPALIPLVEADRTWKPGFGIEAIEMICSRCGFIRIHSAQVLRRRLKETGNGR